MRIITGVAKGKRLVKPEGRDVRPTPERVKEGIFSALQFDTEGRRVLDLFSGSGQLGLEAADYLLLLFFNTPCNCNFTA